MNIRIINIPPGEAPDEVRAAWVGLVLPVTGSGRGSFQTVGVLTRPKSWIGLLIACLLGRTTREEGYRVEACKAVEILSAQSASAAQWWREHAALSIRPGALFVFAAEVCQEVIP